MLITAAIFDLGLRIKPPTILSSQTHRTLYRPLAHHGNAANLEDKIISSGN